jgi:DNA-binding beta-propeller fold protein YncE
VTVAALVSAAAMPLPVAATAPPRHAPIAFGGCIANHGAWGCQDPLHDSLAAASGVAVSPDGASVYVAASFNFEQPSIGGNSLATFARAPGVALRQQGCLANPSPVPGPDASDGCEIVPQASLHGAEQVIVSPDGRNAYVISEGGGAGLPSAITELTRLPSGRLAPFGCIAADTSTGCAAFPHHGAEERTTISSIAISPDGADVYVGASESSAEKGFGSTSISQFARAADGALTEVSCIATKGAGGCAPAPEGWGFGSFAISPDGADLYSLGTQGVEQLAIGADGALVPRGCVANGGAGQCVAGGPSFFGPSEIAVAPDGAAVYVAGHDSLSELARAPDGSLAMAGCLGNHARGGVLIVRGCVAAKRNQIGSAGIAASPDGRIYLTSSGQVAVVGHEPGGSLVERGCIGNTGRGGRLLTPLCAKTLHPSLRGAEGVAVSPNGRSIYVASLTGLSVTWLKRPAPAPARSSPR